MHNRFAVEHRNPYSHLAWSSDPLPPAGHLLCGKANLPARDERVRKSWRTESVTDTAVAADSFVYLDIFVRFIGREAINKRTVQ